MIVWRMRVAFVVAVAVLAALTGAGLDLGLGFEDGWSWN